MDQPGWIMIFAALPHITAVATIGLHTCARLGCCGVGTDFGLTLPN